jgi:[ribosomal protein S18]-alanine N-acetyltransferase
VFEQKNNRLSIYSEHLAESSLSNHHPITIRQATEDDRQKLAMLVHFEVYVHRHLDWRPPLDWLGSQPYLVAEKNGKVVAALACPPDPPNVSWLRLFAVSSQISLERAWQILWPAARSICLEMKSIERIAVIPLQRWFRAVLQTSDFSLTHRVVMLSWDQRHNKLISEPEFGDIVVRQMNVDDLPLVHVVDSAAFRHEWKNSQSSLELAYRQATIATVAELDGDLVGYQISTSSPMGGHLARLAVLPGFQRKGIGSALVRDVLWQFERRGAERVTVNTQENNAASLALYQKAGFVMTGETYPVFQYFTHSGIENETL